MVTILVKVHDVRSTDVKLLNTFLIVLKTNKQILHGISER
jgi:hypothetical protein